MPTQEYLCIHRSAPGKQQQPSPAQMVVRECPGVMMPGSSVEIREMAGP